MLYTILYTMLYAMLHTMLCVFLVHESFKHCFSTVAFESLLHSHRFNRATSRDKRLALHECLDGIE